MNFDEDIKIFDSSAIKAQTNSQLTPKIESRDALDSARAIGFNLAESSNQAEKGFELDINDSLLLQRRLLLCFAVSTSLEEYASSVQIARTALNTFYDTLKRSDPEFYDDIGSQGAMTFYYHAKRQNGDTVRRIGQTFAMLCGNDGDPVSQELGEALYCRYVNMVREHLEQFKLAK